jgi:hypothetical protein
MYLQDEGKDINTYNIDALVRIVDNCLGFVVDAVEESVVEIRFSNGQGMEAENES